MKNRKHWEAQAKFTRFLNGDRLDGTTRAVKKGMASFYVVIFAILVFIVLVLAFINIMLSETLQSSGSDLSASALDSAQAGVEDAKTAIMQCLELNGNNSLDSSVSCGGLFSGDCNSLASYLYASSEAEVEVGDVALNQAYTCVTLDNKVESLRATLSPNDSNGSVFIVPLYKAESGWSSVQVSWYSEADREGTSTNPLANVGFPTRNEMANRYPMLQMQMITANTGGSPAQAANSAVDRGAAVLVPVSGGATSGSVSTSGNTEGEIDTTIGGTQVKKAFKREGNNAPVAVNCSGAMDGYACTYTLTGDITQMDYLVFTNPYNDREVSIEVTALTGGGAASFTNVQVEVDSTGRASNYYRRIQTRLTLADPDVPVPTYALNLGGGDGPLSKKFAVTRNCWLVEKNELKPCKNGKSIE